MSADRRPVPSAFVPRGPAAAASSGSLPWPALGPHRLRPGAPVLGSTCGQQRRVGQPDPRRRVARQSPVQVAGRGGQRPDRRRARAGEGRDAAAVQLRRLHQPRRRQVLREEVQGVRRQGRRLDVQRHERGAGQDPLRGGSPYDIYFPSYDADRQARHRRPGAAAATTTTSRTSTTCGRSSPTRSTTGEWQIHGPLHDLHDRDRLAGRPGEARTSAPGPTRTTCSGTPRTPAGLVGPGRLPRGHLDGDAAAPAGPTSTPADAPPWPRSASDLRRWRGDPPAGDDHRLHGDPRGQARHLAGLVGRRVIACRSYLPKGGEPASCATGSRPTARGW